MKIVLDGVTKVYATREGASVEALQSLSTTIEEGEFVTLIGPSGCGKTTLLSILAGLDSPTSGTVEFGDKTELHSAVRPGVLFQQPILLPWRTALQNVLLPSEVGDGRGESAAADLDERARHLLDVVGLHGFENKYPWELSGGMQQRVALARGLLRNSSVLLLDEPFSALDEFTREQMNLKLLEIWNQVRCTVVFVTHNIFEAVFLSDRVFVMTPRPGKVAADMRIDLPRPRRPELLGTAEFAGEVGRLRSVMDAHWGTVQRQESI